MSLTIPDLRRLKSVAALPGYRLLIGWHDAPATIICLAADIEQGGVFAALADEGKFAQVRVGDNGYLVEWPEPADEDGRPMIDIDGDSLFALGEPASAADDEAKEFAQPGVSP